MELLLLLLGRRLFGVWLRLRKWRFDLHAGLGEAEVVQNFLRQDVEDQFHLVAQLLDESRHDVLVDELQLLVVLL